MHSSFLSADEEASPKTHMDTHLRQHYDRMFNNCQKELLFNSHKCYECATEVYRVRSPFRTFPVYPPSWKLCHCPLSQHRGNEAGSVLSAQGGDSIQMLWLLQ